MQNYKTLITIVIALAFGIFVGYLIFGHQSRNGMMSSVSHVMLDGSVMSNADNSEMGAMMANMNAGLQGKAGDSFDQAFLNEMIMHHEGAVQMAQLALTNAKHQEIKNLASNIIEAQNKEIAEMKTWQKNWYNQ
ncbi:MAG: DUF305 domain-containing protein [Bacteroidetes bacterium]|nr:DUF305 domain-containing protein [Bacteroidota bacterium]